FYDFFIQQLEQNKCYLKYFCYKKSGKVSYHVVDQVDNDLQRNIVTSDEDLKDKLSPYDISCFKKQILISNKSNFYVKEKNICPDVTLTTQNKEDRKISDTLI
ncbi:pathogenicity determinant protein PdpA1, partial [Francisella tularensis subsp. holarctica]|nr:pathogenicity determinant protein PdpA1 [Francisella tularensis subsp. holarctica]